MAPIPIFLLISEYTVGIEEVEAALPLHGAWVEAAYRDGRILTSGRRVPPVGGAIVARGRDREEVEEWIATDPFQLQGVARYEIYEFGATDFPKRSDAFDAFVNGDPGPG